MKEFNIELPCAKTCPFHKDCMHEYKVGECKPVIDKFISERFSGIEAGPWFYNGQIEVDTNMNDVGHIAIANGVAFGVKR